MAGFEEESRDFRAVLDGMLKELRTKHRSTARKFLDLQRTLVEDYRRYVDTELSRDDEALKNLTRLMMSSCTQALAFHREHRTHLRDVHATMTEAYLSLIDQLAGGLEREADGPQPGGAEKKRRPRSAGSRRHGR